MFEFIVFFIPFLVNFSIDLLMIVMMMIVLKIFLSSSSNMYVYTIMLMDDMSMLMILMSCWVMMPVMLICAKESEKLKLISMNGFVMFVFFYVNDVIMFFIMFELSLFPIMFLVISFGQQPERVKSGRWMFLYTLLASIPLFFTILQVYSSFTFTKMISFMNFESEMSLELYIYMYIGMMFAMMVKIPLFMVHSWLPKAHVEAPLEGSMILAGIMLKMGVFGLIRFMMFMPFLSYINLTVFSVSIMGSIYSCWMALSSNDVKMTVAYSSVSHMNFMVSCLMCLKVYAVKSSTIIMISHGLCSSMLFFIMTEMYMKSHSRSIFIMKGFNSFNPISVFTNFMTWCMNLAAPPSMPFMGEILGISCVVSYSFIGSILCCTYMLTNSFYSLFNFSIQCHSFSNLSCKVSGIKMLVMLYGAWLILPLFMLFFFLDMTHM